VGGGEGEKYEKRILEWTRKLKHLETKLFVVVVAVLVWEPISKYKKWRYKTRDGAQIGSCVYTKTEKENTTEMINRNIFT